MKETFERKKMVSWYTPWEIIRTAVQVSLSSIITSYVDRRESQRALPKVDPHMPITASDGRLSDLVPWRFHQAGPPPEPGPGSRPGPDPAPRSRPHFESHDWLFDASWADPATVDRHDLAPDGQPVYIDFIADVGDGWDPTYTMATKLAQIDLKVRGVTAEGTGKRLKRANLVVIGGDCVYPAANRREYRNRLRGPLRSAFSDLRPVTQGEIDETRKQRDEIDPGSDPASYAELDNALDNLHRHRQRPLLAAIPGNHDWYDGLTGFLRVFCQGSPIGAWQTFQTRSYFAVELPGDWVLFGVDIELPTRIDQGQLAFFRKTVDAMSIHQRQKVIVVTSKPAWLFDSEAKQHARDNFWYFVHTVLEQELDCSVRVVLAGDMHHYARYSNEAGKQLITCGGGGSYLSGTHELPAAIRRPEPSETEIVRSPLWRWTRPLPTEKSPLTEDDRERDYVESKFEYPSRRRSREMVRGVLLFAMFRNNWWFCTVVGAILTFSLWTLRRGAPAGQDPSPETLVAGGTRVHGLWNAIVDRLSGVPWSNQPVAEYLADVGDVARAFPFTLLIPAAAIAGSMAFCFYSNPSARRWTRRLWGFLHALAQLIAALSCGAAAIVAWRSIVVVRLEMPVNLWTNLLFLGLLSVFVGMVVGTVFGIYLFLSERFLGWHLNEVFLAQTIPDYRSFVRLEISAGKDLTIYPISVEEVPRRWRRVARRTEGSPRYEPIDFVPEAHLIEGPIRVGPGKDGAP